MHAQQNWTQEAQNCTTTCRNTTRPFQLQPQPVSQEDRDLVAATTPEESHLRMADASGWRPECVRQRALAEAFGSVFVH